MLRPLAERFHRVARRIAEREKLRHALLARVLADLAVELRSLVADLAHVAEHQRGRRGRRGEDVDRGAHQLERVALPTYYGTPYRFAKIMRNAIALNGSFFNTQRMVRQYVLNAYYPGGVAKEEPEVVVK